MEKNTSLRNVNIFRIIMSVILTALLFALIIGEVHAQSCPFHQQADRTIINFPDNGPIVSNEDLAHAIRVVQLGYTSTEPVVVDISLYGYDSYSSRVNVSQPNEKYYITFRNGGAVLATSNSTNDLADNVAFAEVNQTVNYSLYVPAGVDNIVAVHGVYPDTSSPNSLHPVCAAIDVMPTPSCSASFSPTSLTAPGASNLSWNSSNADRIVGSCTGPIPVTAGDQALNYSNFPVSFTASQTGTETCTFVPSKNGINGESCSASVIVNAPLVPNLLASCSATPSSVSVGGSIAWNATASGGSGSYTYSWTGTDSLSGSDSSISKTYTTAGSKLATITVVSGTETVTANCSATVTESPANLSVSCSATPSSAVIGGSVAWNATASGGSGSYTYSWTGTDSLSGSNSSVSKTYSTSGEKIATVTVISGTQTATANCSATITTSPIELSASCSATPSSVSVGGSIAWNATASGGSGSYTYSWTGTDSLSGSDSSISKTYTTAGSKLATITVVSGTETVTANCSATVTDLSSDLTASCSANPGSITVGNVINWSSVVSGGTGNYSYLWSGTDSLSGTSSSASLAYSSVGTKNASVTVTSGTSTAIANCSATVTSGGGGGPVVCTANCGGGGGPVIYSSNSLSGYCEGVPSNGKVGDQVIWNVYPSGGNGSYSFNWYGSEGATGYGYSILKTYTTPGAKTMSVNIYSGGESISRTCSITVGQVLAYVSPSLTSVYLSEIPYTGLSDLGKVWFFVMGLSLWSLGMAYFLQKRKNKLQTQKIPVIGEPSYKEEIKPTLISQNEVYSSAICAVEDCARENNAIISSEATISIAKNCLLHNGNIDLATKTIILSVREAQGTPAGEWIAIGEKDL